MNMKIRHKANRLLNEKSPYLLQHAYNPVDWYSWSQEAFEKAKKEDKPIFLSIGYSTCHWCHVMERESFEDEGVAELLNKHFIPIKVDREERPDIDNIYMTFCQTLTGHGGWPLNIFMTSDKKPFYAGTYFPKNDKYGHPGLISILKSISKAWYDKKDELISYGDSITKSIKSMMNKEDEFDMNLDTVEVAIEDLESFFDEAYGGFGTEPKFPTPHNLLLLMRYWKHTNDDKYLKIVDKTLESMYRGGIFDHIGFGFSRYSTDRKWLVPHFEKMLYDNALLGIAYTEGYQSTGKALYKNVAEKIYSYILRDMISEEGGFYSAEDADSERIEGKFYVWDLEEVKKILGEEDAEIFSRYYNITDRGNFEGKSIPNLIEANFPNIQYDESLANDIEKSRQKLFEYREKRVKPFKDDKILTSWNGLMIASLSYSGRILGRIEYIKAAERATSFIFNKLRNEDDKLFARYRDGESKNPGTLDDYAFLIWGLIELYEATFNAEYLKKAVSLSKNMIKLFWDDKSAGFYLSAHDSEELIIRPKDVYDGAIPSGNSVAAYNMLRLSKFTGEEELNNMVIDMFKVFGSKVNENPSSSSFFMMALLYVNSSAKEIVIVGDINDLNTKKMINKVNGYYLPFSTVILNDESDTLYTINPFLKEQSKINNNTTLYLCENYTCHKPVNDAEYLDKYLQNK